jgi:hypothetical protein
MSTPSLYFSLPSKAHKEASVLLELDDDAFKHRVPSNHNYVHFDYCNGANDIPPSLQAAFDTVVIDPPFVTRECWQLYAQAAYALMATPTEENRDVFPGKVFATTLAENAGLMHELFNASPLAFRPCIPHLVYQYLCFANYESSTLAHRRNPEVDGHSASGSDIVEPHN